MKQDINLAFKSYHANPTVETYEVFGRELLKYLQTYIRAHNFFGNKELADDSVSITIIKVLEKLDTFKGESSFKTWVTPIFKNTLKDALRDTQGRAEEPIDPRSGIDYDFEDRHIKKMILKDLVKDLSEKDQQLIRLKLDGWEDVEVAEKMELSKFDVENRWKALKTQLSLN